MICSGDLGGCRQETERLRVQARERVKQVGLSIGGGDAVEHTTVVGGE